MYCTIHKISANQSRQYRLLHTSRRSSSHLRTYVTGQTTKTTNTPPTISSSPPILSNPLFPKISHSLSSFSPGCGLCNQSSFSISCGYNSKPSEGVILYFAATVCVFTSSSSSNEVDRCDESESNAPANRRSSLFAESRDERVEDATDVAGEGEREERSRYRFCRTTGEGGRRCSDDPIRLTSAPWGGRPGWLKEGMRDRLTDG